MFPFFTSEELSCLDRALREWLCSGGARSWNSREVALARKLREKINLFKCA